MWSQLILAGFAAVSSSAALSEPELRRHMEVLAGPALEGRLPLTPGGDAAAEYLAAEFRRIGLRPGGTDGFFHAFDVTINQRPTARNLAVFEGAGGERWSLEVGREFTPVVGSRPDRMARGSVVFAGYGLKQEGWDDYAGLDVAGKVVMVLRGVPEGRSPAANGQKARWAADAGARAIVFVGPDREGGRSLPNLNRGQGIPNDVDLVAVGLHEAAFTRLTGIDFRQARAATAPGGRELPLTARFVTELEPNQGRTRNVIGVLPGRDPKLKDEVIIIGAHFDHLGWGEVGSRTGRQAIHFGADDNASGTVGLLALARYFAESRTNRRTYIFQGYCAEEVGLVGSRIWASENEETLKRAQAMINMDMIGRLRDGKLVVFGTGTATEFDGILGQIEEPGVQFAKTPSAPGNSDHAGFVQRGVPVLFFHTDLHPEYHTENDTIDTINFPGMGSVLNVVRQTVQAIDAQDARLTFVPQATTQRPSAGRRVRVGFIPEMGDAGTGEGVLISGVLPDSPAARAGFRAGDRITRIGDIEVKTLEDLQRALTTVQAGRAVRVAFLRGGQRMEAEVTPTPPNPAP